MTIIQHDPSPTKAPRLTGPRPTHYRAVDGSLQPFTVCHRVSHDVAGVRYYERVDSLAACERHMRTYAMSTPVLHYVGVMTVEVADRLYPAGPRPVMDEMVALVEPTVAK